VCLGWCQCGVGLVLKFPLSDQQRAGPPQIPSHSIRQFLSCLLSHNTYRVDMRSLRVCWTHFTNSTHLHPKNSAQMAGLLQWTRRKLQPASPPRRYLTSEAKALSPDRFVEEETLPDYGPEELYPVHIGDVFNEKYQVLGNLGYGATQLSGCAATPSMLSWSL
jgi:hypothetical protein